MKTRLPQAVVDNLRKESIVPEPGRNQDDRIKELVSQSLDTAIRAFESEQSEPTQVEDRPPSSRTSTDSRETIKAAKSSEPWEGRGIAIHASSRRCVDEDAEDQGSSELFGLSRSTTTSDSGYSSGAQSLSSSLSMEIDTPFATSAAGIGSIWSDSAISYSMANKQFDQHWSHLDHHPQELATPGIDSVLNTSPTLSADAASGDHQQFFHDVPLRPNNLSHLQLPSYPPNDSSFDWSSFLLGDSCSAMMDGYEG